MEYKSLILKNIKCFHINTYTRCNQKITVIFKFRELRLFDFRISSVWFPWKRRNHYSSWWHLPHHDNRFVYPLKPHRFIALTVWWSLIYMYEVWPNNNRYFKLSWVMFVPMSVIYVDNISHFGLSVCFWQIKRLVVFWCALRLFPIRKNGSKKLF